MKKVAGYLRAEEAARAGRNPYLGQKIDDGGLYPIDDGGIDHENSLEDKQRKSLDFHVCLLLLISKLNGRSKFHGVLIVRRQTV